VPGFAFFFGFLSALASGLALIRLMPPKGFRWERGLHWLVASSQFWTAFIYFLVMAGALTAENYARLIYPVSILILSPGWVALLTRTTTRQKNGLG